MKKEWHDILESEEARERAWKRQAELSTEEEADLVELTPERVIVEIRTDIAAGSNIHGITNVGTYESWVTYGGLEEALRETDLYHLAQLRYRGKGA